MPYVAPSTVVAGQTYGAAAHNVIVNDVIDHESRIKTGIESYTTVARDALTGVATGTMIYNSTEKQVQVYNGSSWIEINDIDNTNGVPSGLAPFFAAWTDATPACSQSASLTYTGGIRYLKIGKFVWLSMAFFITSTGTAGHRVGFSLPFTAANTYGHGTGQFYDASSTVVYPFIAVTTSTTRVDLVTTKSNVVNGTQYIGVTDFTAAAANGDIITGNMFYEAA
jgi:hypothetical protein